MIRKSIVLFAVILFAVGCGTALKFTVDDFGKTVQFNIGNNFDIVLDGNPTTGYTWDISKLPSIVKQSKEPDYRINSNLVGAGGKYTFHFTAVRSGKGMLELLYRRPWDKTEPINAFYLNIEVK